MHFKYWRSYKILMQFFRTMREIKNLIVKQLSIYVQFNQAGAISEEVNT